MRFKTISGYLTLTTIVTVFLPFQAIARFQIPNPAHLTVVINTINGDGTFHFDINVQDGSSQFLYNSFDLPTINGVASHLVALNTFGINTYFINQTFPQGWNAGSIGCVTDNPNNGINIFTSFIEIPNPVPDSNVTCTFNVSKAGSKVPVLFVPGLFGTKILKDDRTLWVDIDAMKNDIGDQFLDPLSFQPNLLPLDNSLITGEVLRKATGTPEFLLNYDYTEKLIDLLTSQEIGYTEGKDLFTFPYDWRFGVSEDIVSQLKGQIDYILNQTEAGKIAGKVDIVAHSTGGLIVKKYVMKHPNDHHIGKAVFVGVPNLGAPKAIKVLLEGDDFGIFFLSDSEMKKIAQNMPIAYDLAPTRQYYNSLGSFYHLSHWDSTIMTIPETKDLNFDETYDRLINLFSANTMAASNAQNLHSSSFDEYDLRTAGIDLYNIVGCKSGTVGTVYEYQSKTFLGKNQTSFEAPKLMSGDGTVPFMSADSLAVDGDHTFFAPKANHGKMPSADGIRQQIVNLVSDKKLDIENKILTRGDLQLHPEKCQLNGHKIWVRSPVAISVIDQEGHFSGLADDGSIQNDIPGADYEIWGEHKYVFLPTDEGQVYSINIKGTSAGTFTINDQSIEADNVIHTEVFSNLPVTTVLTGTINLGNNNDFTTLVLRENPTSIPIIIQHSSILNANESQDIIPPTSTSTLTGTMGQPGFYRSDVAVSLSAVDPIINNNPSQTSGMLQTYYKVDADASYSAYMGPISLIEEGSHSITFFSTDKAGNNEEPQKIVFTIDKTPPEFSIQFNPAAFDMQFTGTDNLSTSSAITIMDNDDLISASDAAGNTTVLGLKDKHRKRGLKADIKSLSYNSIPADISKTQLHFDWFFDKKNTLQALVQQVKSKKDFNIVSLYAFGKTMIAGKDQTGKISKTLPGLQLLKLSTQKGDFNWSY